jgi:hypothetical protein
MSTKLEEQRQADERRAEKKRAEQKALEVGLLEAVVRDHVLGELGRPPGPHRVQVTCVWGDRYRVNVFVGPDAASFKVAHSYFVEADEDGKVLASTPAITRAY